MNEGTGATAFDKSGSGNAGTLTGGASWAEDGKLGKSVALNGTTGYIDGGSAFDFTSQDFTFSFWIYLNSYSSDVGGQGPVILYKGQYQNNGYYSQIGSGGEINFSTNQGGVNQNTSSNAGGIPLSAWTLVTFARSGATVTIYSNGVDVTSSHGTHSNPASSADTFRLGHYNSANIHTNGAFDDLRVYTRTLSAHEVARLYQQGSAKRASVNTTGLVGYWRFNEGAGTTAADVGSGRNTGTLTGSPTWVSGKYGGGLSFGGQDSGDYVDVGNSASINSISRAITVAGWVKLNALQTYGYILSNDRDCCGPFQGYSLFGMRGSNSPPSFQIWDSDNTAHSVAGGSALPLNSWQHVVGTYDGATMSVYINGALSNNASSSFTIATPASYNLSIGSMGAFPANYVLDGSVDDVRIYNRALSPAEIANLYNDSSTSRITKINTSSSGVSNGLVGWWTFDGSDLTSTTVADRSGQGNNGTLNGGPRPASGRRGQALYFDGSNDYVSTGVTNLPNAAPLSIAAWLKLPAGSSGKALARWEGGPDSFNFLLAAGIGSTPSFYARGNGNNNLYNATGTTAFAAGTWYHVVATIDSSNTTNLFVNGVLEQTQSVVSFGGNGSNSTTFFMGAGQDSGTVFDSPFAGFFDDVRIYNRVLSAAEVLQLYNMGK